MCIIIFPLILFIILHTVFFFKYFIHDPIFNQITNYSLLIYLS